MSSAVTTRSTAGPGFAFEDLVAAELLSRFLIDMPIPGTSAPGNLLLSQVRALGWKIDDLMVVGTDALGNELRLGLSCKSNMQVNSNGLPKDFVADAWEMWRDEANFRQASDRIGLVVRGNHPGFSPLWHDIKTWCDGDEALALGRIEATEKHRKIFASVRTPGALEDALPAPAEVLKLIRAIDIFPLDFQLSPSQTLADAKQRCREALVSGQISEADNLWDSLVHRAEMARTGNGTIVLPDLIADLAETFALKAHPSIGASLARLRAFTADHLASIETTLPNGHAIQRREEGAIASYLAEGRGCLVSGDSGVGKSALIRRALEAAPSDQIQLWFDPEIAAAATSAAQRTTIGIDQDLLTIFSRCPGTGHVAIFDSAERLPENSLRLLNAFLTALAGVQHNGKPKWQIIIATQGDALGERVRAQANIGALPTINVDELSDSAIQTALQTVPQLRWAANDVSLVRAVANMRTLSWVVASAPSFSGTESLASVSTISDRLWMRWTSGKLQLQGLMMRLAERDAAFERSFPASQLDPADAAAFDCRPADAPLRLNGRNHLEFEHDLASDWARYQRLKEIGHDIAAWGPLASQPLWIAALRLYGQHLLTIADQAQAGWDRAFADASAQKNVPACDLLLDALCLDHRMDEHLAARADLLFGNEGALLLRLMNRFIHLATAPVGWTDPKISSGMRMYLEADMRRPIAGRWLPMARFLDANREKVTELASTIVSRICALWLEGVPLRYDGGSWPLRDIFARVALDNARTLQAQFIGHELRFSRSDGDSAIFKTALVAAADMPVEVSAFALEMARRRPLNEEIQARASIIRDAERLARSQAGSRRRPVPSPERIMSFRKALPAWPIGASGRVNGPFRKAVVHNNALGHLMNIDPQVATEVLLACLVDDQPMEDMGSMSMGERLGMANDDHSDPPMYWKSPFFSYLAISTGHAIAALQSLFAFAVERWKDGQKDRNAGRLKVHLDKKRVAEFVGTSEHFRWAQDSSFVHGQLNCAADALERWLVMQVDKGMDVSDPCSQLLAKGGSVAVLGVLTNLGKHSPALFSGVLAPLLELEDLYRWDERRMEYRGMGFQSFQWSLEGEPASQMARDWWFAPHRELPLRQVARTAIASDADLAKRVVAASKKWRAPRAPGDKLRQKFLQAELDPANYRFETDPASGEQGVRVELPVDLHEEIRKYNEANAKDHRPLTVPLRCEEALNKKATLADTDAAYLASLLPSGDAPISPGYDERRLVAAAAGTLSACCRDWLEENPQAKVAAHRVLREMAESLEASHEELRRRGHIDDPALKFVAIGTVHAYIGSADRGSWDRAILALLSCRDRTALAALMRTASDHRAVMGDAWFRLNQLLVFSAGLDILAPRYEEQERLSPIWNRWLARFRAFGLSGGGATIEAFDPVGVARRAERLLERRRATTWPDGSPRLRGKSRRFAGLSSHILKIGFEWLLDMEEDHAIMEVDENRVLVSRLLEFELWRLLGDASPDESAGEDELDEEDDEYDTPSDLGHAVLLILPRMLIAAPHEICRATWQSVFAVGPLGHSVVERFIASWFIFLYRKPDAERFMTEWKAMLDYAFEADWRSGRKWFRGSEMLVHLMALNSFQILDQAAEVRERLPEMKPYFSSWATNEMKKDEESIASFAHFLTRPSGICLQLDGVIWLNEALRGTERFYRGAGNNVAEALDAIITARSSELVTATDARNAMIEIAALLVSLEISTGLGLQARIASIK